MGKFFLVYHLGNTFIVGNNNRECRDQIPAHVSMYIQVNYRNFLSLKKMHKWVPAYQINYKITIKILRCVSKYKS